MSVDQKSVSRRPPVIIIGGHENGLALAWSLGRSGIPVYALGCASYLRHSRYVRWIPLEDGRSVQDTWADWLLGPGLQTAPGAVILPCNDRALELIVRRWAALRPHYKLPETNEMALAMLDKKSTYELAKRLDIAAPRIWTIHHRHELVDLLPEMSYPCALKPRHSHVFEPHFPGKKMLIAQDEKELVQHFDVTDRLGLQMLVTELIPGRDEQHVSYWTYIDDWGRPLFHFTKAKLRQYPVHFGLGTYHVTTSDPEVAELGLRFIQGVGLRGVAVVEFKRDARDGRLKLIECNARFSMATEITTLSGIDLPLMVYNRVTGRPLPDMTRYRAGVRLWFPYADYSAFRSYQEAGELSATEWLRSLCHWQHLPIFRWFDPGPALAEAGQQLMGMIDRRLRRWRVGRVSDATMPT